MYEDDYIYVNVSFWLASDTDPNRILAQNEICKLLNSKPGTIAPSDYYYDDDYDDEKPAILAFSVKW